MPWLDCRHDGARGFASMDTDGGIKPDMAFLALLADVNRASSIGFPFCGGAHYFFEYYCMALDSSKCNCNQTGIITKKARQAIIKSNKIKNIKCAPSKNIVNIFALTKDLIKLIVMTIK
jgi:hypothetical protein